ncbi:MAG: hypothetical protein H6721_07785 [Sandaracinus sp.]|nr:hypothetical protein [Sandaracinus sp.]
MILFLLGGDPLRAPSSTAKPLATLLETTASAPTHDDAWALKDALDAAAREAFGPPRFLHFTMPR